MAEPKYKNADISQARLKDIETWFTSETPMHGPAYKTIMIINDLLAMLHDQRWRKLSEEIPELNTIVDCVIFVDDNNTLRYLAQRKFSPNEKPAIWALHNDVMGTHQPDYWRPIPLPPKEI